MLAACVEANLVVGEGGSREGHFAAGVLNPLIMEGQVGGQARRQWRGRGQVLVVLVTVGSIGVGSDLADVHQLPIDGGGVAQAQVHSDFTSAAERA